LVFIFDLQTPAMLLHSVEPGRWETGPVLELSIHPVCPRITQITQMDLLLGLYLRHLRGVHGAILAAEELTGGDTHLSVSSRISVDQ
jgi:hypothetical protein